MFGKYWGVNIFVWWTEDGPSTCTTAPYYLLKVKVCGFDESCNSHGCEIVGWVSGKSGCLCFPGKMMSINLSEHT